MQAQVTLSTPESKRIIARAVVRHSSVKRALENGIVAVALGSTNAYVAEEILGESLEKSRYVSGYMDKDGTCVLPCERRLNELVLERGKKVEDGLVEAVKRMQGGDVIIKGANALDAEGNAGIMLASEVGGTIARVYGIAKAKGIEIIIPAGMDKLVPSRIADISRKMGMERIDRSIGMPVGMFPVAGEVITESRALELLFGVECFLVASGSMEGEHAMTFLLEGGGGSIKKAFDFIREIKGEPPLELPGRYCSTCNYKRCPSNPKCRSPLL